MEMNLNSVIEKIKEEGIAKAEYQAARIVGEAEEKARLVVEDALDQKEEILKEANKQAADLRLRGESALKQASRDVMISLKARIIALMDSIIKTEVSRQLSPETLKDIISKLVMNCGAKGIFDLEILLGEQEKEDLRAVLEGLLKEEIKKGLVIKVSPLIKKGFRIGTKDKKEYYDFSDDAIAEAFNFYLNKKVKEILDAGAPNE